MSRSGDWQYTEEPARGGLHIGSHQPRRGDDVEAWLKRQRDSRNPDISPGWHHAIDALLDRYRECADHGLSLRSEDDERGDP